MQHNNHQAFLKSTIKAAITDVLYSHPIAVMRKEIDAIIIKNTLLGGYKHSSFIYDGVLYIYSPSRPLKPFNRLCPEYLPEFKKHLEAEELLTQEMTKTTGYVIQVLNIANSLEEFLGMLPEALHSTVIKVTELPNTIEADSSLNTREFVDKHREVFELIKSRLVLNLLL